MGRVFMGGLLHHARGAFAGDLAAGEQLQAADRLEVRGLGAAWEPALAVTYGPSNRTQMIRLPGPGRIENRCVNGAANPYLACAAILAAGLDGIENKIDPGTANSENLYEMSAQQDLRRHNITFMRTTPAGSARLL